MELVLFSPNVRKMTSEVHNVLAQLHIFLWLFMSIISTGLLTSEFLCNLRSSVYKLHSSLYSSASGKITSNCFNHLWLEHDLFFLKIFLLH